MTGVQWRSLAPARFLIEEYMVKKRQDFLPFGEMSAKSGQRGYARIQMPANSVHFNENPAVFLRPPFFVPILGSCTTP